MRWTLNESYIRRIGNDEPMLKYFPYSVGVNNVLRFADQLKHLPAYVANLVVNMS